MMRDPENQDMADMIRRVATPGGTTEAAVESLRRNGLGNLLQVAVADSARRSEELRAPKL